MLVVPMPIGALQEMQKNKLADDGGGLTTTIVFHQRFFHSLFSPTAFHPLTYLQPFTHRSL